MSNLYGKARPKQKEKYEMDRTPNKTAAICKTLLCVTANLAICLLVSTILIGCAEKPKKRYAMDGRELSWEEMNLDQHKWVMRQEVIPLAQSIFQSWRPDKYREIDCTLCHGEGAKKNDFHMPTAHLPRLSGELFLGTEFRNYPDTTKLKLDRLVPGMAEILGQKQFSLITRRGFGCYSCHFGPKGPQFGHSKFAN
jgi:hypothetical protein